ncbi:CRISPR-associated protein Csx20 [Calditerrivibrio nitroreducens]|uniref:CRISPR-associated protein n=1 Tax=Calditerrivibrio nitroreducens (strain DSM 19672 / NBRC 101217 / Yu37-1) TaxID=768670 RepID=E4TFE3_CALNY|nr:CRISPR-associated protein Csx20 [Calditerrivibrio nitroreducens]ADR19516.1 hypothetical protein Calni_1608 [Calditerrivibrio nitroreducens DSM 19672]
MKIYLLFSHTLTDEQKSELEKMGVSDIIPIPEDLQFIWSNMPPAGELNITVLNEIIDWLSGSASEGDYILIQGDFGATYYMVNWAFKSGLIPIYATTERVVLEENKEGDRIVKKNIFRHVNFRRYVAFE